MDPFEVLTQGKPSDAGRAVKEAIEGGANAIWPGYKLIPALSTLFGKSFPCLNWPWTAWKRL